MRFKSRTPGVAFTMATLAAALVLGCGTAAAQDKPFKISGAGEGPKGLPLPPREGEQQESRLHWAVGTATHLGKYYGEGTVQTDTADFSRFEDGIITGEFGSGSPFVFAGANGKDRLVTVYGRPGFGADETGTFTLTVQGLVRDEAGIPVLDPDGFPLLIVEAAWIAEFVAQPHLSEGKFAGVTGSWVMYAYSEPFVLGSDDPVYYSWDGEGTLSFPKKK